MQEPPASAPDDEARSSLSAGKALIVTEQYERAAAMLTDALAAATEDELPEVRYYLAYAQSMTGDTPAALKLTDDLEPAGDEEWAADFVILRAQLLVDASAFSDEVKWLAGHAAGVSTDPDLAPAYYFLLALGHRGMGDISKGKQNLSKVVSLSAKSELGKAAAHLLRME
jgi:thioredoxin-like negative regulator of GroEL